MSLVRKSYFLLAQHPNSVTPTTHKYYGSSMTTTAQIYLWGEPVGAVRWDSANQVGDFSYSPSFVKNGMELSPIHMPLHSSRVYRFSSLSGNTFFNGLPGLLANSLPGRFGRRLLQQWAVEQGLNFQELDPVAQLCLIGDRGVGALEFVPDSYSAKLQNSEVEFNKLLKLITEFEASVLNGLNASKPGQKHFDLLYQLGLSTTADYRSIYAAWNDDAGKLVSGLDKLPCGYHYSQVNISGVPDHNGECDPDAGCVEMAFHLMAVESGITMMESHLLQSADGVRHFVTRRFDREDDGTKFHIQSLSALSHASCDFGDSNSYDDLFETARAIGIDQSGMDELYARMVFNVLTGHCDDHGRSHAFLMNGSGEWYLAPAYNLTFSQRNYPNSSIAPHYLQCNQKRSSFLSSDLEAAAVTSGIRNSRKILESVKDSVAHWKKFAKTAGVPSKRSQLIESCFRRI